MKVSSDTLAARSAGLLPASPRLLAIILASALFMEQLDSTVLATALPAMATSFAVPPLHLSIAVTAYLVALAVFIPCSGWIVDRMGSRTVLLTAIFCFTMGSILCGVSQSIALLVAARILQGLGGAMIVPIGRLVLLRTLPKSEYVSALSWVLLPAMVGPVVGPPVGGFIVTYSSWRWIFFLNVPFGILGLILATLFVPQIKEPSPPKFDGKGLALSGISLSLLVFALEGARDNSLTAVWVGGMLAISGLSGLAYIRHALRHSAPVLDLRLLAVPTFFVSALGGTLFRIGMGAIPFLLPLMLQLSFGVSAVKSGTITFASAAGGVVMKALTAPIFRTFGYRHTLIGCGIATTLYLVACAALRPSWPIYMIYAVLLTGGVFRSVQFNAYGTLAYADIPSEKMSAATSFYTTLQQLSITLGVAISAALLSGIMDVEGHAQPTITDFTETFLIIAALAAAALPLSFGLTQLAGSELSGHRLNANRTS